MPHKTDWRAREVPTSHAPNLVFGRGVEAWAARLVCDGEADATEPAVVGATGGASGAVLLSACWAEPP
eukprot:scaffold56994_cov20-Tisochrysis_lutea.AAC.3